MFQFKNSGPHIEKEDIAAFESRYGITLPLKYASFLLDINGGQPEACLFRVPGSKTCSVSRLHFLFGMNHAIPSHSLEWILDMPSGRVPRWLLPIGRTEGADMICMALDGVHQGSVYLWDGYDPSNKLIYHIATSFDLFLGGLFEGGSAVGVRMNDFDAANKASGYFTMPTEMMWHYHQDGVTMQLVPWAIYFRTMHIGWAVAG